MRIYKLYDNTVFGICLAFCIGTYFCVWCPGGIALRLGLLLSIFISGMALRCSTQLGFLTYALVFSLGGLNSLWILDKPHRALAIDGSSSTNNGAHASDLYARVLEIKIGANKTRLLIEPLEDKCKSQPEICLDKSLITIRSTLDCAPGDHIILPSARTWPIMSPSMGQTIPAYQIISQLKGIKRSGTARKNISIIGHSHSLGTRIEDILHTCRKSLINTLKSGLRNWNLAACIMTGNRYLLDRRLEESIRTAGLAHILAISGLHMNVLFMCVGLIARLAAVYILGWQGNVSTHPIFFAMSVAFGLLYMGICQTSSSCLRAFIMHSLVLFANMNHRHISIRKRLGLSAIAICSIYPYEIIGPSFQMSFISILCLSEARSYSDPSSSSILGFILRTTRQALLMMLGIGVLSLYHFGALHPYGTLSNILAVPYFSYVLMPATFTISVIGLMVPVPSFAFYSVDRLFDLLIGFSTFFSSLPRSNIEIGQISSITFTCSMCVIFLAYMGGSRMLILSVFILGLMNLRPLNYHDEIYITHAPLLGPPIYITQRSNAPQYHCSKRNIKSTVTSTHVHPQVIINKNFKDWEIMCNNDFIAVFHTKSGLELFIANDIIHGPIGSHNISNQDIITLTKDPKGIFLKKMRQKPHKLYSFI